MSLLISRPAHSLLRLLGRGTVTFQPCFCTPFLTIAAPAVAPSLMMDARLGFGPVSFLGPWLCLIAKECFVLLSSSSLFYIYGLAGARSFFAFSIQTFAALMLFHDFA